MKAERARGLFRHGKLAAAVVAPLLTLGAAAAPVQDKQDKQDEKVVVQVSDSELSRCGASPSAKTAGEKRCLRGKVRAITTETRTVRAQGGGLVEGPVYFIGRDTYDDRGNVTLAELSDGSNGPAPVGVLFRRGVISFDEQGRQTASKWYQPGADEPASVLAYSYDERGNRVKIDSWRTKPDMHMIQEFSYDAEGREVGITSNNLTPGGWRTSKSRSVTTVEGGLTITRTYSADGALRGRGEFLRDERGNTLSEELYRADARGEEQLQWKVTYQYDSGGFLQEAVYHKAEAWLGARAVYEYDEHGNCTSLTRYHADGTFAAAARREYQYDAVGNWVTCVSFSLWKDHAPLPQNVVRRRITYD